MAKLSEYNKKRDFSKTSEPKGSRRARSSRKPVFVIQKHDATALHYDLRLEIDGVLKSWAVPKGPSLDPKVKRLAIHTEDHPMEYGDFEGVIPEGEYGAGPVMIWDKGTYKNIKQLKGKDIDMEESYKMGTIEVVLDGKKIDGGFALIRIGDKNEKDYGKNWLLIKMRDEESDARRNPVSTQNKSVKSGKTMTDIEKAEK